MNKKQLTEGHKAILKTNYESACNAYLRALLTLWDLDGCYGFWIGDEIGGVYCYGDDLFIGMDDMRYCVENNVSYDTFYEWQEYCVWAHEFDKASPNLKSWCMGCPRFDKETMKKLSDAKLELDKLVRETKEIY